jgi:O-antigen/teichoic acid export membrane protein
MMNLLVNSFEVVDRYMLLYFAGDQGDIGHRLIGQFHSARLLPVLLFSLASAVGSMLLPYLSAEFEKRRPDIVASKTIATIKFSALGFMGFAILSMAASPFLFQVLWKERFELGQDVMPWAMVTVLWSAIALIAQNYLWCVEKTRAVTISLAVGLVVNIALNWILIPVWGLHGAVWATMLATALNLVLILFAVHRAGCTLDRAIWIICTLPILLGISTVAAAVGLAAVIVIAGRTHWLLSVAEQQTIEDLLRPALSKLRWQHACFITSR